MLPARRRTARRSTLGTIVRRAAAGDAERLVDLYVAFHDFHALGMPAWLRSPAVHDRAGLRDGVARLLVHPETALFVADAGEGLVGMAEVHLRREEDTPVRVGRTFGHLQSLMVLETHRRRGTGGALLAAAERWAQERGATEVQLDTWEFGAGPLRFYEARGYATVKRKLVRALSGAQRDDQAAGWVPRERWEALVRGEDCPLCRDLASAAPSNAYRHVVADLAVSQLWLAANQSVPGYCVLVCARHVREPYDLGPAEATAFFEDMTRAGQALERVFDAVKMNFELLGNAVPHLHCHIKPRYYGDPAPGQPIHPDERVVHLRPEEYRRRVDLIRGALAAATGAGRGEQPDPAP